MLRRRKCDLYVPLCFDRSTYRAVICASTAAETFVSVDYVLAVSLGNAFNRAVFCASAASDALISNLVSH